MKIIMSLLLLVTLSAVVFELTGNHSPEGYTSISTTKMPEHLNTLTEAEMKEGWISLFDGKTTKGWHVFQNKSDGSAWKAVDGTLMFDTLQASGGGDLLTDSTFENYHFSIEWKVSQNGNSGLIFNIQDDPKYEYSWHTGPEMQVLDNSGHPDAKIIKHRAGDLYDLISCSKETVKPWGKWNKAEIKLNKGKLDLFLNGTNVVSTTMWDDNWNKLVAGSKFKNMPDFAKFKKGHLALQDHGNQVWFRNIKIKKL